MIDLRRLLASSFCLSLILASSGAVTAQRPSTRYTSPRLNVCAEVGHRDGGHWVLQRERVWVPGECRIVRVPARFGLGYDSCGQRIRVLIEPAHQRVVQDPGRWEWRTTRVWVPDRDHRHVARVSRSWPRSR